MLEGGVARTVAVVIGAVVAAGCLLFISTFDGDTFVDHRVGSAGEWFAGVVGAAVLAWAVSEPARMGRRDRAQHQQALSVAATERQIERERAAAMSVMHAIADLDYRPGGFQKDQPEIWRTHLALELHGHLLHAEEARERVRVATDLLRRYYHALSRSHDHPEDVARLHEVLPLVLEATFRSVLAVVREQSLPEWSSKFGDRTYRWPVTAEEVVTWMQENGLPLEVP